MVKGGASFERVFMDANHGCKQPTGFLRSYGEVRAGHIPGARNLEWKDTIGWVAFGTNRGLSTTYALIRVSDILYSRYRYTYSRYRYLIRVIDTLIRVIDTLYSRYRYPYSRYRYPFFASSLPLFPLPLLRFPESLGGHWPQVWTRLGVPKPVPVLVLRFQHY